MKPHEAIAASLRYSLHDCHAFARACAETFVVWAVLLELLNKIGGLLQ